MAQIDTSALCLAVFHHHFDLLVITPWSLTMARQEDGWPLGLQQLNRGIGLARSLDLSGSVSFSTLLTFFASSSSSSSSSSFDLESEETEGSFPSSIRANTGGFGTLLSSPPQRQPHSSHRIKKNQTNKKPKNWLCSLCLKPVSDDEDRDRSTAMTKMVPVISLGYLLEEERKAMACINRKSGSKLLLSSGIDLLAKN